MAWREFWLLFFCFAAVACVPAYAEFVELEAPHYISTRSWYVAPNERHPWRAMPAFSQAEAGVYISVGTERGFMGAANSPAISHLVLIDQSPAVTLFNRINRLLLKISSDRNHYLQLRLNPSPETWEKAAEGKNLRADEKQNIQSWEKIWQRDIGKESDYRTFKEFHAQPINPGSPFYGVNYLYRDDLFFKLQEMAKAGNIAVGVCNLNEPETFETILKNISAAGVNLSVLDVSNAWQSHFIKPKNFTKILSAWNKYAAPKSLLMTTGYSMLGSLYELAINLNSTPWTYSAFTLDEIRTFRNASVFTRSLSFNWLSRISPKTRIGASQSAQCAKSLGLFAMRLLGKAPEF